MLAKSPESEKKDEVRMGELANVLSCIPPIGSLIMSDVFKKTFKRSVAAMVQKK